MKHLNRLFAAAAALMILTGCGSQTAQPSPEPAETAAPASETEAPAETEAPEVSEADEPAEFDPASLPVIALSSENLHDGVWDDAVSNTDKGTNSSPQLSWEPVGDAACYAVYMVDTTATFWLHWKSLGVTETELPAGWASADEYVGPYPPSGTHEYEIRVFALKEQVAEDKSIFDRSNYNFDDLVKALDAGSGGSGNVLAYGTLKGTFTRS